MTHDVIIIDDHPIFRRGLRDVLSAADFSVVAEGEDYDDAIAIPSRVRADIAILDVGLPGNDGLAVLAAWQDRGVSFPAIMLSLHEEPHVVRSAMAAGARGYVLKDRATDEIVTAVHTVLRGGLFVSQSLQSILDRGDELDVLSPMERTVLRFLAENKTSVEIASDLGLAVRTVQNHRAHAAQKLGLTGPHRLLQFALERREQLGVSIEKTTPR